MRIGIDIGGTNVRVLAGDQRGEALQDPIRSATPTAYGPLLDLLVKSIGQLSTKYDRPESIGVGVPGAADVSGPRWIPALPYLDGSPLGLDLAKTFGCPARFANDAQCALVAESRHGVAKGVADVALVAVGTGIGGALMYGGRLVRGNSSVAGAFGWLPGPSRRDSRTGPWEAIASGTALSAAAAQLGFDPIELVTRARAGEREPLERVQSYAVELGRGLAAIASALDPSVIVLAGGLSDAFDVLAAEVKRAFAAWASPAGQEVRVVAAMLGADAGSVGALHIGWDAEGATSP